MEVNRVRRLILREADPASRWGGRAERQRRHPGHTTELRCWGWLVSMLAPRWSGLIGDQGNRERRWAAIQRLSESLRPAAIGGSCGGPYRTGEFRLEAACRHIQWRSDSSLGPTTRRPIWDVFRSATRTRCSIRGSSSVPRRVVAGKFRHPALGCHSRLHDLRSRRRSRRRPTRLRRRTAVGETPGAAHTACSPGSGPGAGRRPASGPVRSPRWLPGHWQPHVQAGAVAAGISV